MKRTITIKVFGEDSLTYFVRKSNYLSVILYRAGHVLRRTGYQTQIVG